MSAIVLIVTGRAWLPSNADADRYDVIPEVPPNVDADTGETGVSAFMLVKALIS